jgi:nicotinamide-nucleotide amidase
MNASIITVGDEILIGQVIDTNSAWLGQQLSDIGIRVRKSWSVSDDHGQIILAMQQALDETDILFMTGGLGPTKDDITKKAIADFLGVDLYFDQPTFERIQKIFVKLGRVMSPHHHDQCLMPVGVQILRNSMGTAPGMFFRHNEKMIISMPGVPYEMKAIMNEEVLPWLSQSSDKHIYHKTILTACTGETAIESAIGDIISEMPENIKIAYLPSIASVRVRLSGLGKDKDELIGLVEKYAERISQKLGDIVFGYGDSSLEKEICHLCVQKNLKISTAESCTGGAIAAKLVTIPGSSSYFMGGIVAYDNDVKNDLLKVKPETLLLHGAVSEQTVIEMIDGVNQLLKTNIAVSISGIAGPDGGTIEKPVGTIWVCVGNDVDKTTYLLKTGKDRAKNIETATIYALDLLRRFILKYY